MKGLLEQVKAIQHDITKPEDLFASCLSRFTQRRWSLRGVAGMHCELPDDLRLVGIGGEEEFFLRQRERGWLRECKICAFLKQNGI